MTTRCHTVAAALAADAPRLAQRLYLLLAHPALLNCTYCHSASDYKLWHYFASVLPVYALHMLAFGILTAGSSALGALDALAARARGGTAPAAEHEREYALDRSAWRKSGAWCIVGCAALEYCVLFGGDRELASSVPAWVTHVSRSPQRSPLRATHPLPPPQWSYSLPLLRSLDLATLFLVVYAYPTRLAPAPISAIWASLRATIAHIESIHHRMQIAHLAKAAVLRDDGLRSKTQAFWEQHLAQPSPPVREKDAELRRLANDRVRAAWRDGELLSMQQAMQ